MTRLHAYPPRFGICLMLFVTLIGLLVPQAARAEAPPVTRATFKGVPAADVITDPSMTFTPTSNGALSLSPYLRVPIASLNTVTFYSGSFHDAYINPGGTGPCTYPYTSDDYIMAYHCGAKVPVFTIVFNTPAVAPDIVTIGRSQPNADGYWSTVTPTMTLAASAANNATTHVYNIWPGDDAYQFLWPGYQPWIAHEPPNNSWYNAWIAISIGTNPNLYTFKLVSTTN